MSHALCCHVDLSCCHLLLCVRLARPAEHVMRALQQLGFDEWAAEVKASHEEFKEEAKSEFVLQVFGSDTVIHTQLGKWTLQ